MTRTERRDRVRADLLQTLGTGRMTAQKVAEKSGWNATTVIQHLKAMQKDGLVHVPQWFNHRVMLWVAGPGPNRRRPRQISKPEAMERWRKKQLVSNGAVRAH